MYHPLLVFDGRTGFPLAAMLRPGNTHGSHGALAVLKRLIKKLKKAYPEALILFRADAGFAVPALYRYLERQEIRYVIGFITNKRVLAQAAPLLLKTQRQYQETGEKQRLFTSFNYQAESWTRPRRIIAKVEYTHLGIISASWSPTSAAIPSSSMTTSMRVLWRCGFRPRSLRRRLKQRAHHFSTFSNSCCFSLVKSFPKNSWLSGSRR